MKLAAYTDYVYHERDGAIYAERAFALFLDRLGARVGELVLPGRLVPRPGAARYRLGPHVRFVALPHYDSLAQPSRAIPAMIRSLGAFDRAMREVDIVWLLGPHPLAVALTIVALIRGKRVAIGVRQDYPEYVRSRHPGRPWMIAAALILECVWRFLAFLVPTVVVGPALRRKYRHSRRLETLTVSLVEEDDIADDAQVAAKSYSGDLQILSVGRLDEEKNPTLLADVLAAVRNVDPRWHLTVCGEGPLGDALAERLEELGVSDYATLAGYVPVDGGLRDFYRDGHVLLHVSFTEGFPQVLIEAFAAGIPVVATGVGGVTAGCEGAALLMPPGDADIAARLLNRVADDSDLRRRLVDAGRDVARRHTIEAECDRLEKFLTRR